MENNDKNNSFAILALVAIVAVIGVISLVMMMNVAPQQGLSSNDLLGQPIAMKASTLNTKLSANFDDDSNLMFSSLQDCKDYAAAWLYHYNDLTNYQNQAAAWTHYEGRIKACNARYALSY